MYGVEFIVLFENTTSISPIIIDPKTARGNSPAPSTIPEARDQNKNTKSIGSFIAVLKRTIDNAPTIPSDNTTFDVTASITKVVSTVSATKDTLNGLEYITPIKVFLYIKYINIPTKKAAPKAKVLSIIENPETFSIKLDLKISLNVISNSSSLILFD